MCQIFCVNSIFRFLSYPHKVPFIKKLEKIEISGENGKTQNFVRHKAGKFYFAGFERRAAVSGQIKSENGAVLVWVSAQKFQQPGNMCLIVSLQ